MNTTTSVLPVIVGVDDSEHAMHAALWAGAEAAERAAPLRVIHALDAEPGPAAAGPAREGAESDPGAGSGLLARVADRVRAAHPDLEVACSLVYAAAPGALIAAGAQACLLVVGSHGRGGFAGLPLGSVSRRVLAHAHCPTAVIRDFGIADARAGDLVLGMALGEPESTVLFAFAAAERARAALRAVHAWMPYPMHNQAELSDTDILARQAVHDMATELKSARERFPDVPVTFAAQRGSAPGVLSEASREARLTVIGGHHHRWPLPAGVGHTVQGVLRGARSPVAVVPEP